MISLSGERAPRTVVVIATGGTIASRQSGSGAIASGGVDDVLHGLPVGNNVATRGRDLLRLGSYLFGHRELRQIAAAVAEEVSRDDVDGVVVTLGTDTMEETAFLLDLVHTSSKPVVLTGAQRAADQPDTDGPRNLADAITVAASDVACGCGALLVFAGRVHSPRRVRKHHTIAPDPFRASDSGPLGTVGAGEVHLSTLPNRPMPLAPPGERFEATRVDVVPVYPGADAALADAAVAAGAAAVVLAGTGAGNGNHALLGWTRRAVAAGVGVGLATRVAEGPTVPIYGNGGGVDLVDAGAVCLGGLPLYHGRLLLALLRQADVPITAESVAPYR